MPAFVVAVLLISASPGPAMALIFRRAAVRRLARCGADRARAGVRALPLGAGRGRRVRRTGGGLGDGVRRAQGRRRRGAALPRHQGVALGLARRRGRTEADTAVVGQRRWWRTFGEGVVVQLANPKAAVFMIAFYPQFVPADRPLFATTAGLAAVQVVIETALLPDPRVRRRPGRGLLPAVEGTPPARRDRRHGPGRARRPGGRRARALRNCSRRASECSHPLETGAHCF